MKRCVIIGGADIGNYSRIRSLLSDNDFYISCDCGLKHSDGLGITPNLIIGDFDSAENPMLPIETLVLPHRKDDTDTVYAVKEAVRRGFEEFLLLGVTGNRLDHTLGNIYILVMLDSLGKKAEIADDYSLISLVGAETAYIGSEFEYFSLVNITGLAKGISIKNAEYNLENAEITPGYQYGVSNEPLKGKTAEVSVAEGRLLLIKDFYDK